MAAHLPIDSHVHHAVLGSFVDRGFAPSVAELAATTGERPLEIAASLDRLADNHGLVLHPGSHDIWIAHPFSASPTAVWVAAQSGPCAGGWWAPCVWCAMGVARLVGGDVTIHTRFGGERDEIAIRIRKGRVVDDALLVHFPIPPRAAWVNVQHFCASVLPFRSEAELDAWCARHRMPRGAAVPIAQTHALGSAWYGRHLERTWVKWTVAEAQALFDSVGLTGPFWSLDSTASRF